MQNKIDLSSALEVKTEQLSIINQFSSSLLQLDRLDELFDYVTTQVVKRLGFVDCVIYIANENSATLHEVASMGVSNSNSDYSIERSTIAFNQGITGYVASTGRAVIIGDVSTDSRYIADARPAMSELCVPLVYKQQVLGVIDCEHPVRNYFTDAHLEILTTVAHLLSAKINQVNTVENLQQTVSQLNTAQKLESTLLQIANLTYQANDLDAFLESLHGILTNLLRADNFLVALYDKQIDILDLVYIVEEGVRSNAHKKISKEQLKNTASYYLLNSEQPLLLNKKNINNIFKLAILKWWAGSQNRGWVSPLK